MVVQLVVAVSQLCLAHPVTSLALAYLCTLVVWILWPLLPRVGWATAGPGEGREGFFQGSDGTWRPLPSLYSAPDKALTVVVAGATHIAALCPVLDEWLARLLERQRAVPGFSFEVIVVVGGGAGNSSPALVDAVMQYVRRYGDDCVRAVSVEGPEGAMDPSVAGRKAVQRCRGAYVLLADAQGLVSAACLPHILSAVHAACKGNSSRAQVAATQEAHEVPVVVIGSRPHCRALGRSSSTSWLKAAAMHGARSLVAMVLGSHTTDAHCPVKLLTRSAARAVLPSLHLGGASGDLELLHVCHGLGVPLLEVPVAWDGPGDDSPHASLATLALRGATLVRNLLLIRVCYLAGIWQLPSPAALAGSHGTGPASILRRQ